MLRKRFSFLQDQSFLGQQFLRRSLTILALAVVLMPTAWAQPKFKILHTVPGGLFSGLTFDARGNLYGVTGAGGDDNQGTIFYLDAWRPRLDPDNTAQLQRARQWKSERRPHLRRGGQSVWQHAGRRYTLRRRNSLRDDARLQVTSGWTFDLLYEFCHQYHCPDGGDPSAVIMDGPRQPVW